MHDGYTPKRAMVVVAHPDDIELSCAGTIAKWVRDGAVATYLIATSGDATWEKWQAQQASVPEHHDVRIFPLEKRDSSCCPGT